MSEACVCWLMWAIESTCEARTPRTGVLMSRMKGLSGPLETKGELEVYGLGARFWPLPFGWPPVDWLRISHDLNAGFLQTCDGADNRRALEMEDCGPFGKTTVTTQGALRATSCF